MEKLQRRLLRWAIISIFLFVIALLHNEFIYKHDYDAAHNFSYNIAFFMPVMGAATLIAYFVAGITIVKWKILPSFKILLLLLLTIPIIITVLIDILHMLRP